MEDGEHSLSIFGDQIAKHAEEIPLMLEIEKGHRFVQQDGLGVLGEHHCDPHALLLPTGQGTHVPVIQSLEAEVGQGPADLVQIVSAECPAETPVGAAPAGDKFPHRDVMARRVDLRKERDPLR